nr:E3 ubiquitin-protein ligase UPL2-like [Tanacetum cinerariifolium]
MGKGSSTLAGIAQHARHSDELKRDNENLMIDIDYYLEQQSHLVVSCLCASIEGTSPSMLADCLGLDPLKVYNCSLLVIIGINSPIIISMFNVLVKSSSTSYLNYITFLNEKVKPQAAIDGIIMHSEAIFKSAKVHRKPPQSFTTVIEFLLESIITFAPPLEDKAVVGESSLVIDMEIDVASSKGKGKAIVSGSEEKEDTGQESFESLAKVVFILKLLNEILLMYGPYVHVLVRKDAEFSSSHGGGIFLHILARRRIFIEVNNAFSDFADNGKVQQSPGNDIQAFVDLLDDVLAARSLIGSSISGEASATFIDVGLVRSLTRTLHLLDLDHADLLKVAPALVKVLELVTKEHVYVVEANATKTESSKTFWSP